MCSQRRPQLCSRIERWILCALAEVSTTSVDCSHIQQLVAGQTTASICNVIDERNPACMIIRPLRNISDEELRFLCPTSTSTFTSTGDITTSNFMTNAQPNFPGTTTTVLSVVTKLSNTATTSEGSTKASIRCSVCFSSIADDQDTLCEPCCRYLSQFDAKESAQLKRCLNNKQLFYCFCWSSLLVYA